MKRRKRSCKIILINIFKRVFDIFFSIFILLLVFPIMIIISILIWLEDRGPILFTQERTGLRGKSFKIYKFRSMKVNHKVQSYYFDPKEGIPEDFLFKSIQGKSTNVTKIGKFLRKSSLDELPQFLNTLIGNMSIIGPRPEIPAITMYYNEMQKERLKKKPGITGLAQVNGRSDLKNGEKLRFDIYYVENPSFLMEFKILWKTILVVLASKGAV